MDKTNGLIPALEQMKGGIGIGISRQWLGTGVTGETIGEAGERMSLGTLKVSMKEELITIDGDLKEAIKGSGGRQEEIKASGTIVEVGGLGQAGEVEGEEAGGVDLVEHEGAAD